MDQMRAIARASGATLNDVVLAMCSGALRSYLLELDALPDRPLVAMVPVSLKLREGGHASAEGNALGTIMVSLATDLADAGDRLAAVHAGVTSGKEAMSGMSPTQI